LFFEMEEDAGGAGRCDSDTDGLPVWMDERMESRN
jgi:hypothetical protein